MQGTCALNFEYHVRLWPRLTLHNVQEKSDIYMFAITMWEMMERDLPFKSIPFVKLGAHVWGVSSRHQNNISVLRIDPMFYISLFIKWCNHDAQFRILFLCFILCI